MILVSTKNYYYNKKLLYFIISLFVTGVFYAAVIIEIDNDYVKTESSILKIFIINYWYFLIIWIGTFSVFGVLFDIVIIFLRGFILGSWLKYLSLFSFKNLVLSFFIEMILFLPVFILLNYQSLKHSSMKIICLFTNKQTTINFKEQMIYLFMSTIMIILYSVVMKVY